LITAASAGYSDKYGTASKFTVLFLGAKQQEKSK
jgi:hypothetical protein